MANGPASVPHPAICPECEADPEVLCPRNIDGRCLECGAELCAAHLAEHFRAVHCMALTLDHAKADA